MNNPTCQPFSRRSFLRLTAAFGAAAFSGRLAPLAQAQTSFSPIPEVSAFYQTQGGEAMFGPAISGGRYEGGRLCQYFTRARLEFWPENPPAYQVMPGLLGVQLGKVQPPIDPATAPLNDAERRYFPETGHVLSFAFKRFWEQNGGIDLLGYPITELLFEAGRTVQYFQRARLEWRPENPEQSKVMLGELGLEYLRSGGRPAGSPGNGAPLATCSQGRLVFALSPDGAAYSLCAGENNHPAQFGRGIDPCLSPDGSQLAWASRDPSGIYVRNLASGETRQLPLTSYPWQLSKPLNCRWSPDGRFIATTDEYIDYRPVRQGPYVVQVLMDLWRVVVIDLQSGQAHIIVYDDFGIQPTWLPDGRLLFVSRQGLYVVNNVERDRQIKHLAGTTPLFRAPSVAPDGSWIACQWRQHDHDEICAINSDGSGFRLLTSSPLFSTPVNNVTPAVSPDGSRVAFLSDRGGSWNLHTMKADGSEQRAITSGLPFSYQNVHEQLVYWGK